MFLKLLEYLFQCQHKRETLPMQGKITCLTCGRTRLFDWADIEPKVMPPRLTAPRLCIPMSSLVLREEVVYGKTRQVN